MLLFFFSSRRRHTRLQGDWSSDVCSSDLGRPQAVGEAEDGQGGHGKGRHQEHVSEGGENVAEAEGEGGQEGQRSEERRVGKECGCRRAAEGGGEKRARDRGGGGRRKGG